MKSLTPPCFVRVENPAERQKLINWMFSIGYHCVASDISDESVVCNTVSMIGRIDCGSNIELFKALAAMNDSNDLWQYHVCLTDHWSDVAVGDLILKRGEDDERIFWEPLFRKATADEIIEKMNELKNEKL